ncbi:hypothetical protein F5Y14DRAFT_452108 [Nemania sp. NC0429]|nr:hypothetical protein F5Y14DRAFT_452108 [Nemania sp. NC0429]
MSYEAEKSRRDTVEAFASSFRSNNIGINFGDARSDIDPVSLLGFYELVLQADKSAKSIETKQDVLAGSRVTELEWTEQNEEPHDVPQDEGHTFLAESGLMNDTDKPVRKHNQTWLVRGGSFVCVIGCKMAIKRAEMDGDTGVNPINHDPALYAKPMRLSGDNSELKSNLQISITRKDGEVIRGWTMEAAIKSLPTGLWGKYSPSGDPLRSGNNINDLLSSSSGTIDFMAGVRLTAPPPHMSGGPCPVFGILDAGLQRLTAGGAFPEPGHSNQDWKSVEPLEGKEQWEHVRQK